MGSPTTIETKPHAVCIPFPAQGHINPMLKIAKIMYSKGFHIKCLAPFKNLLSKLNDTSSSKVPPVSCIVSDGVMSFTLDVAQELWIPNVLLWTTSACGFLAYSHYHTLIEKGLVPLKDASCLTNGYLDTVVDSLPALDGICLKDFPNFIRTTNPDEFIVHFAMRETLRAKNVSAIILNTFEELEPYFLNALSSIYPPIYSIGPLNLLMDHIDDEDLNSMGSNLWKEEPECLQWLDSKEPNSVVYVNFGSVTVMTPVQLVEFSWGLANSNQTFLWIIRPNLVLGDSAVLPPEFLELTKDRSFLASWCPQEKVLGHRPAVGGFLTHSGWNSTLESISSGVPMLCWPFFAEQQTNCWFSCGQWGIAMEIDNNVKSSEVERLVRELMVEEKGKEMRKKALELKQKAEEAIAPETGVS